MSKRYISSGYTSKYERAAIVGYWRMGATLEQIGMAIPYLSFPIIKRIINNYKNSLKGKVVSG